jgi:hypothetical protein
MTSTLTKKEILILEELVQDYLKTEGEDKVYRKMLDKLIEMEREV